MDNKTLWKTVLSALQLDISSAHFNTWFPGTKLESLQDGKAIISCTTAYTKERLLRDHEKDIKKAILTATKQNVEIELVVKPERKTKKSSSKKSGPLFEKSKSTTTKLQQPQTSTLSPPITTKFKTGLNKAYTFETYVVGNNNRLAHAVASSISQSPGNTATNPFFLYASVGLGKTHLIHAIGNYVLKHNPTAKVMYCTGENFTNQLLESIQRRKPHSFRNTFRNVDVLIIDDVQFIAGRDSTQEEFFNTFNALHNESKQIVLASDQPPSKIPKLEARLSSRFGGGMMADIQAPDLDVRTAILRSKREELNYTIADETLDFIASVVTSNIRELIGALSQVVIASQTQPNIPQLNIAQTVLGKNLSIKKDARTTPRDILNYVCEYFEISKKDIKGKSRVKKLVVPRQVAMYLLRTESNLALMDVGELLGGRDHTTVMHGVDKTKARLREDAKLTEDINKIKHNLSTK